MEPAPNQQLTFDLMPERLFVCTPSKLAAYEDCPRRYRFTYVDRPSPPKGPPWAHNSLGASVHTALRSWWELPRERRQPGVLPGLLKATWVREGYRDAEHQQEAFANALSWLDAYVGGLDPDFVPLAYERQVAAKTPVIAFSGRADRIDERAGELVIVDYKTGRAGVTQDDARGSRALALYAFAAARTYKRRCYAVELHHLPTGAVAAHRHSDESLARQVSRAEGTARDIMAAEAELRDGGAPDQTFPAQPGRLCSWCDYRRHCPEGSAADAGTPQVSLRQRAPGGTPDTGPST